MAGVDLARSGDDEPVRPVLLLEPVDRVLTRQSDDSGFGAEDRPSERLVAEGGFEQAVVDLRVSLSVTADGRRRYLLSCSRVE